MSGNLTNAAESIALDAVNGLSGSSVTIPLKLRLMTSLGGDVTPGTEVTGGSYTAQNIMFSYAAGGQSSNTNAITFSNMPACTVVGFEIVDSAEIPRRLWSFPAASIQSVVAGQSISVAATAITVSID